MLATATATASTCATSALVAIGQGTAMSDANTIGEAAWQEKLRAMFADADATLPPGSLVSFARTVSPKRLWQWLSMTVCLGVSPLTGFPFASHKASACGVHVCECLDVRRYDGSEV